ncbi:hypothetical protein EDC01DRAFT_779761 [Geopyxis carbonaria]|nr:hypothetical protein EDC01DRAFT_779761 [Geopyxis carbonaria]
MPAMSHYTEFIQDVGSCDNTGTEAFEGAHHWMCKLADSSTSNPDCPLYEIFCKKKPTSRHADLCLPMLINEPMLPKAIAATALIGISHGRRLNISNLIFHTFSLDVFTEGLANHFKYLADKHPEHLGPLLRRKEADDKW